MNQRGQYGNCRQAPRGGEQQIAVEKPPALDANALVKRSLPFVAVVTIVIGAGVYAVMRHGTT